MDSGARLFTLDAAGGKPAATGGTPVLPGADVAFGDMKVTGLGSVLAKLLGVEAAEPIVPHHPTLGDVDSPEAYERYAAAKRAYKASRRAQPAG